MGRSRGGGSTSRLKFPLAGEEEQSVGLSILYVQVLCVFIGVLVKALFFCLYLMCEAVCLGVYVCLCWEASPPAVSGVMELCVSSWERRTHPGP